MGPAPARADKRFFVHVGWDQYVYVGSSVGCPRAVAFAHEHGLFAEPISASPYVFGLDDDHIDVRSADAAFWADLAGVVDELGTGRADRRARATAPGPPLRPAPPGDGRRRRDVVDQAATAAAELATARAEWNDRDAAAQAECAGSGAARRAALAAARAAARGDHATTRAISAAAECEWPEVAQPGAGLPGRTS
nr:hypothetical protein [Micromonospora sp. KC721]